MKDGNELVATYFIKGIPFDVYGCYDQDTPENEFDFYDVYMPSESGDLRICINEGNPFYELPTRQDVMLSVDDLPYEKYNHLLKPTIKKKFPKKTLDKKVVKRL
jgi:hypothetical protein